MSDSLHIPCEPPENFIPTNPSGLTDQEAAGRARNEITSRPDLTAPQIILKNLLTLFNLLNIGLAVCLALVGSWRNMLFLGVVVSNLAIGTVQELRARRTIRKLQLLSAPTAHVIRNGQERPCRPEALVEGDLVIFRAGDQVTADAVVTEGSGAADESLLTGESDAVSKQPGDWLMSGSYVTEGRLTAQLVHVGDASYAARLTRAAKEIRRAKSALMTDLNRLIRWVSYILVPAGLLLFLKQHFILHAGLAHAVPSSVAAMIGMIPEGLMLLTSVAMAVGVVRLGKRNTLVQELYGIETLARADMLCLDKTGTLTTGKMTVTRLQPVDADEQTMRAALRRFLGAFDGVGGTLQALRSAVEPGDEKPVATLPFSSSRKCSAASFADGMTFVLGAPSFVLGSRYDGAVLETAEGLASHGSRVLALVQCRGIIEDKQLPPVSRVLGLCVLFDEIRENAADALAYFRKQGVTVKIISGDDPRTASAIGKRVGLTGWDRWVDASALTEEELPEACKTCTVFGRVTPERKRLIVETLKRQGHSVAMTGDGVNDIPALKAADCSIAMVGGSDAAKHAAQLTLLDANFASMPLVVGEGRRVIGNVTRAASLFLVKTLYSFALTLLLLAIPAPYPFQPIQLTLVSALTIGAPSFVLAFEGNRERVQGRFLQTVLLRAVPGAMAVTVCSALSMLSSFLGWPREVCSTLATLSAGCVGLMMLSTVCRPWTRLRAAVLAAMCAAFAASVLLFGHVFFLALLSPAQIMALAAIALTGALVLIGASRWMPRMKRFRTD
ncbi:MAG: HAD-IC family P-type ATPase [Christensenellaceae bacterium]|nr:HAD-IC family P-type ATPase [Christensenellaceae bacterium]